MCRWLAYTGSSIPLEALLFNARHSLIDQSMNSRAPETPTNGDGFGIGWYGRHEQPGLFRSVCPASNDFNLRELAAHIEAPLLLAHIRATSLATIQETNCHPFRFGQWLFVHNGEIAQIELFRRDLMLAVAPHLFNCIQGTTDSELPGIIDTGRERAKAGCCIFFYGYYPPPAFLARFKGSNVPAFERGEISKWHEREHRNLVNSSHR
ncbi:MAG: class II glutamine amidotransferase [Planctomycetes bacterium]|nr:class II glutamine amidotransferase [Planctomycetota bacterium]